MKRKPGTAQLNNRTLINARRNSPRYENDRTPISTDDTAHMFEDAWHLYEGARLASESHSDHSPQTSNGKTGAKLQSLAKNMTDNKVLFLQKLLGPDYDQTQPLVQNPTKVAVALGAQRVAEDIEHYWATGVSKSAQAAIDQINAQMARQDPSWEPLPPLRTADEEHLRFLDSLQPFQRYAAMSQYFENTNGKRTRRQRMKDTDWLRRAQAAWRGAQSYTACRATYSLQQMLQRLSKEQQELYAERYLYVQMPPYPLYAHANEPLPRLAICVSTVEQARPNSQVFCFNGSRAAAAMKKYDAYLMAVERCADEKGRYKEYQYQIRK